tara:strand:+ start:360 stop:821 length:462 start_codon:yes stop_codon:yes gene_type:complete
MNKSKKRIVTRESYDSFDRQRICPHCGKKSAKFIQQIFAQNDETYRGNLKVLKTQKNTRISGNTKLGKTLSHINVMPGVPIDWEDDHGASAPGTIYFLWDYTYRGFNYGEFCRYDCAVQYANFRHQQDLETRDKKIEMERADAIRKRLIPLWT